MKHLFYQLILVTVVGIVLLGCEKRKINNITGPTLGSPMKPSTPQVTPSPLVTVNLGASSLEFWPFTGNDFSGTPQDPINLLFAGESDPRALRAALLFLDGDRTAFGFPNVFPFNCTWIDAIGRCPDRLCHTF